MSRRREHEPPLPEPLAYFLTWATYGTWLPGDERGWVEYGRGWRLPDPARKLEAEAIMSEDAYILDREQRAAVERQICETCEVRGWKLHAVNCRSNHLHVVVTAIAHPKTVRAQLKAWCTRRLKELETARSSIPTRSVSEGPVPTRTVSEGPVPTRTVSEGPVPTRTVSEGPVPTRSISEGVAAGGMAPMRVNWWAERGSQRWIYDEAGLDAAIAYVLDGQERHREF
jgi:hypothetical protein